MLRRAVRLSHGYLHGQTGASFHELSAGVALYDELKACAVLMILRLLLDRLSLLPS